MRYATILQIGLQLCYVFAVADRADRVLAIRALNLLHSAYYPNDIAYYLLMILLIISPNYKRINMEKKDYLFEVTRKTGKMAVGLLACLGLKELLALGLCAKRYYCLVAPLLAALVLDYEQETK